MQTIHVPQQKEYTRVEFTAPEPLKGFPLLSIDTDSYINQLSIQTNIESDVTSGRHCIAIGKACALSYNITMLIDRNHDYQSIAQGCPRFLKDIAQNYKIRRKATILIQNDVWVGNGATILSGVTLHNGCVVATNSVVTKDVPPYAIVGGNPAKVLRYRFDKDIIEALQKIAWWDWPSTMQHTRREDFTLPPQIFIEKYLPKAIGIPPAYKVGQEKTKHQKPVVLFIPDFSDVFPLYPKIFQQYFEKDRTDVELLIYVPKEDSSLANLQKIESILENYQSCNSYVTLQTGTTLDEHILFHSCDYYITTRNKETVRRSCLADLYGVQVFYGTDEPIFPSDFSGCPK